MGLTYNGIMSMPYSRRKRFVDKKYTELKTQENKQNAPGMTRHRR